MAIGNFPGVYPEIKDLSQVVASNSVTACAYVGESEFGPVFKPTLVSNLKSYVEKFGQLKSKYGYMGYSLAVAADTISNHYVVRVVDKDSARYAALKVAKTGATVTTTTGYTYDEIKAAQNDSKALFEGDTNSAFIIVADNPNNKDIKIRIEDSTINTNKAYTAASIDAPVAVTGGYTVTVTCPTLFDNTIEEYEVGTKIYVSKCEVASCNGFFTLTDVATVNKVTTIKFDVMSDTIPTEIKTLKFVKYPEDNETTFSVIVYETVGKATSTLETFKYCTLYPSKNNYGESMFIEDVINGTSDYIQIFANMDLIEEDEDTIIIPSYIDHVALVGGTSGIPVLQNADNGMNYLLEGWDEFKDRSQTNVTLLLNSGYVTQDNYAYQQKMLDVAEYRRDCFCLFDVPQNKTDATEAKNWRKDVQGFNSFRGAISSPWVKAYDSIQGKSNFLMCPSAYVAKLIGGNNPWLAPAGLNRGILSSSTVSPTGLTQYYDETIGGDLYDNQINCIIRNPGAGYVNWGQKTLQQKPSALDRINVARTVIYIETTLRDAARYHLFENNTPFNRMQVTLQFNQFLDTILSADGISAYQVICDESNNTDYVRQNNQMVIDVYLWPVYTSEFIKLNTIVMGADATINVSTNA